MSQMAFVEAGGRRCEAGIVVLMIGGNEVTDHPTKDTNSASPFVTLLDPKNEYPYDQLAS